MASVLVLDNFDPFVYNIVESLRRFDHSVIIYKNTIKLEHILSEIKEHKISLIVLSSGPGKPSEAGCMPGLLAKLKGKVPILGISLGYQAIVESYGGSITPSGDVFYGKPSNITHDNLEMFEGLPNPLPVARYNSLTSIDVPSCLTETSYYRGMTMSVRHDEDRVCGFLFHPESILSPLGSLLLKNTFDWSLSNNLSLSTLVSGV